MANVNFATRIAELESMIDDCPADQQEALRQLAVETRERHAANERNIAQARQGVETLRITEEIASLNMSMIAGAAETLRNLQD